MGKGEMDRYHKVLGVLLAVAFCWPMVAGADELSDLKQELEAQKTRAADLENRINQLEARQKLKERSFEEKIEAVQAKAETEEPAQLPDNLQWLEKIKISGDFRYRYEYIDDGTRDDDYHRNRIRARLGITANVTDEWDLGFRLATGSGDPVSSNLTLEESLSSKPIRLDQAYVGYHPIWLEGFDVTAGKVANPFHAVGKNELIWDGDLNPEGGALGYERGLSEKTTMRISGGGFWLDQDSSDADPSLFGLQAFLKHQIDKPTYVLAGAGYFDYGNLKGQKSLTSRWSDDNYSLSGNTADAGDPCSYGSDFDLIEVFAEFGTEVAGMPVNLWADWVKNTVATTSEDTGWLIGGSINKVKDPGSWQFSYDYRDIELDAVVGQFNSSDFVGGGTGGKGHRFGLAYGLAKNTQAALTYYLSEYSGRKSNEDYDRLQADVAIKF